MEASLKEQVQRLIDASVPELEIGKFIQKYEEPAISKPKSNQKLVTDLPDATPLTTQLKEGAYGAGKALLNQAVRPMTETIGMIAGGVGGSLPGAALGYGIAKKGMDITEDWYSELGGESTKKRNAFEEVAGSAIDVGSAYLTGKMFDVIGQKIFKTEDVIGKLSKTIRKGIEKGIRPTVVGRKTAGQAEEYMLKAESAVKSIINNKGDLKLTNEYGESVEGLPKTLKQFGEAVAQTKKHIFAKYDALRKAAGEKGAQVDLSSIIRELVAVGNDPVTQSVSPGAAMYAKKMAARLTKKGSYTTEQAQDAIAQINTRLTPYYRNQPYDYANQSTVDNLVATHLRKSLDDVITISTGHPGYQALKNQYGSLSAIEKDVMHRAGVDARKNNVGFFGYADIWTAAEVASSLSNPANLLKAAAIHGTKKAINYVNKPDRIVKTMFGNAEKLLNKIPKEKQPEIIRKLIPEEVYRYNPEFKGVKSAIPVKLKTKLQPGEPGIPSNLLPDQQARQMGIKTQGTLLGPEPVQPSGLSMPKKEMVKSVTPEKLVTTRQPGEPIRPSNLFADQAAKELRIRTTAKLLGQEPTKPMPLLKPRGGYLKSEPPKKLDKLIQDIEKSKLKRKPQ
uniref:Uncharacterized protein n=1 Tax=viral metagenome TaxID=1070528 RepID=A0A6M3IHQ2_9ZZZZ